LAGLESRGARGLRRQRTAISARLLKSAAPATFGWIGAGSAAAYTYAWFNGLAVALALYALLMWTGRARV
jgi:hypothetical protein